MLHIGVDRKSFKDLFYAHASGPPPPVSTGRRGGGDAAGTAGRPTASPEDLADLCTYVEVHLETSDIVEMFNAIAGSESGLVTFDNFFKYIRLQHRASLHRKMEKIKRRQQQHVSPIAAPEPEEEEEEYYIEDDDDDE